MPKRKGLDSRLQRLKRLRGNVQHDSIVSLHPNNDHSIDHQSDGTAPDTTVDAAQNVITNQPRHEVSQYIGRSNPLNIPIFRIGNMNRVCDNCLALRFPGEGFNCCHGGKVDLPDLAKYPTEIQGLLTEQNFLSRHFRNHIRKYNSAMAFASFGAQIETPPGHGPYCFRIHGQIYHQTGSLYPPDGSQATYSQLYILEGNEAVEQRLNKEQNKECRRDIMTLLSRLLLRISPYAAAFKQLEEVEKEQQRQAAANNTSVPSVRMYMKRGNDQKRYNEPSCDEVAAIFVSTDGAPPPNRDIVVHPHDERPHNIPFISANSDPMVYPIFFPHGDLGWYVGIEHNENRRTAKRHTVTLLQFYCYRLSIREQFSPLFYGSKLLQQYIVDAYVRTESSRLQYIRSNQSDLRVEQYQGLMDHVHSQADQLNLKPGKVVILPSSFQGSPRAMAQHYQDAMAIVSKYGKPDIFITFTCNPRSPDIAENLLPGQTASDRPDIVGRVFKQQLQELMKDLMGRHVLGIPIAYVYVVEFQKRGLPHCHLLLILASDSKLREPTDIDSVICTEIPNPQEQPELHRIVRSTMIHGPCGELRRSSVCMIDGKCSKEYPKEFQHKTVLAENGYPLYRRRDNGRTVGIGEYKLDNRWIVPYNPYLTMKYNAHINVEACTSIKSVKYLFKYVYKGHDCANVEVRATDELMHDEIRHFLDARYVSAPEAYWRLSEYQLHEQSHSINRLPVHLPREQPVFFNEGQHKKALQSAAVNETKLTAYFKLNHPESLPYCYPDIPNHFVWMPAQKKWKQRQRGGEKVIARMFYVSPKDFERYCLRLLLLHVQGPKSFQHLRTVNEVLYSTFKEACAAMNLLTDDTEWDRALHEATAFQMPVQLRSLFSTILVYCKPSNALELWITHRDAMLEDYMQQGNTLEAAEQKALCEVEAVLQDHSMSAEDFQLPVVHQIPPPNLVFDENEELKKATIAFSILNQDQREFADAVLQALDDLQKNVVPMCSAFYLDGPGGTGKTTVYNALLSCFRGKGLQVAASAWTGIAATLLSAGRTCHNLFKLPVPVDEQSVCDIRPSSRYAEYIRSVTLFIIDEASMVPKHGLRAIDQMLQDVTGHRVLFGGKIFVLGGDFRQVLPVVPKRPQTVIVETCLKRSPLWPQLQQFKLRQNMRAQDDNGFAEWLLALGNGESTIANASLPHNSVAIPNQCNITQDIVGDVFNDMQNPVSLISNVILTPTNESSLQLNDQILEQLPGRSMTYFSCDKALCDSEEEENTYPIEFIHSLTPSGMPPHKLKLKHGAIVMLLRNLDIKKGRCNGTRIIVRRLHEHSIEGEILTGSHKGDCILIPRVKLEPSDAHIPFILQRIQFPVRLAYSMTINKAQGQTFEKLGIFLPSPVFSHGQLYVAFSRARCFSSIYTKVLQSSTQGTFNGQEITQNVVFHEVL